MQRGYSPAKMPKGGCKATTVPCVSCDLQNSEDDSGEDDTVKTPFHSSHSPTETWSR